MWMYTGLCVATIIAAGAFWMIFKKYNATEEEMNALEDKGVKAVAADEVGGLGGRGMSVGGKSESRDMAGTKGNSYSTAMMNEPV